MSARRGLAALALALGLGLTGLAQAHKPSDAYLTLSVDERGVVTQRLDIALRDLAREVDLDRDDDAELRWGEVRAAWPQLAPWSAEQVVLQRGERRCEAGEAAPPAIDQHGDGPYLVIRRSWDCGAGAAPLALRYHLFQQTEIGRAHV